MNKNGTIAGFQSLSAFLRAKMCLIVVDVTTAVISNSYSLLVAHYHPGGSLDPSEDEIATTQILTEAEKILGITFVDHIIVSLSGIKSFRELLPELWT